MNSPSRAEDAERRFESVLTEARAGSSDALGRLLQTYRNYLLTIAEEETGAVLGRKVRASDLVQQTFLDAQAAFPRGFAGAESNWRDWLRRILMNNINNEARFFQAQKRQAGREVAIDVTGDPLAGVPSPGPTPSAVVAEGDERAWFRQALTAAIEQLVDNELRQVASMRYLENRAIEEIAATLDKSTKTIERRLKEVAIQVGRIMNQP